MKPILVIKLDDIIGLGLVAICAAVLLGYFIYDRLLCLWERTKKARKT